MAGSLNTDIKIRVLVEIPVLRKDGSLDVTRCYSESEEIDPEKPVEKQVRKCVRKVMEAVREDFDS